MISTKFQNLMKSFLSFKSLSIDAGLLILRLCCALMLLHGWPKFIDFKENSGDWPDPFHLGSTASYTLTVFAELFCTVLIAIGFFTRVAIIPLIILMLVIILIIHSEDTFADREHAIMYLLTYVTLLFTGPGKFSIDRLIHRS
jgi:putative oxidoreductase